MTSQVETVFLGNSPLRTEDQKVGIIVVNTIPDLGKLMARYFLEWVSQHPEGVISLPTGKTPLSFIRETQRLMNSVHTRETQDDLAQYGIDARKLSLKGLTFVHMDEIYPIEPEQTNSFLYFIRKHYFKELGLNEKRALVIDNNTIGLEKKERLSDVWRGKAVDLSLRVRNARSLEEQRQKSLLHALDQWCMEYEEKIRSLGGLDFFLGGIGPDGHIAFNISGTSFFAPTRLTELNYATKAAAAPDMGGMEIANTTHAITIGLATITYNPQVTPVIMATGDSKAKIVAQSIRSESNILFPATCFHANPRTRFFLTEGAAQQIKERELQILSEKPTLSDAEEERIVVNLSLSLKKPILKLTDADFRHPDARLLPEKGLSPKDSAKKTFESLLQKIERGNTLPQNTKFLHTEPHHDDIMLGYLPYVLRSIRDHSNTHHFATFTYGYTAITNHYLRSLCAELYEALKENRFALQEYVTILSTETDIHGKADEEVLIYLDGLAAKSQDAQKRGVFLRLIHIISEVFQRDSVKAILQDLKELITFLDEQYPGAQNPPHIQVIKGRWREWESSCLWGYWGYGTDSMHHMNLSFYQNPEADQQIEKDITTVATVLSNYRPDVIGLAFDPEGAGPATHYKVLKTLASGLEHYLNDVHPEKTPQILGYRNVWFRFTPDEANIMVPVSLNMFSLQRASFMNSYLSQKNASFPSPDYDGPFCDYAQDIQVQQYETLKNCLGEDFFYHHSSPLIRATRGFVFLKSMSTDELFSYIHLLKAKTEQH